MLDVQTKFTYADYLKTADDKRYELLDGKLVTSPSPGEIHQYILGRLFLRLGAFIYGRNVGRIYCSPFDSKEIEEEANWLSGVLLVPDEAAIAVVKGGIQLARAATHYGVSVPMMKFRINVSGARQRVQRFSRTSRQSTIRTR